MSTELSFFDISPEVSHKTAVFPGDTRYELDFPLSFEKGHSLAVGKITSTPHVGAHVDAPLHYHRLGASIDERSLNYYYGLCQVISARPSKPGARIHVEDLASHTLQAPRVLIKTSSFDNPDQWRDDFASLSPELIADLASQRVILIGIDTPSVDPAHSKALESHQAIFKHDLAILEGVDLSQVPDGLYTLVALPLRLKGADASPVRAILIRDQGH